MGRELLRRILASEASCDTETFEVELLAFGGKAKGKGEIRKVDVPCAELSDSMDPEFILQYIYNYGQNDIQPRSGQPSVSVGDVIRLDGERWLVDSFGFKLL